MTNAEIKVKGLEALRETLGIVDMEKFVALLQNEQFDYTAWRADLFKGLSGREISRMAMEEHDE